MKKNKIDIHSMCVKGSTFYSLGEKSAKMSLFITLYNRQIISFNPYDSLVGWIL